MRVFLACLLAFVCACASSTDSDVGSGDAAVAGEEATGSNTESEEQAGAEGEDAQASEGEGKFSFFVTSLASLRKLSKSQSGFGGDLRYGETGEGAGLRGADKICAEIAELSMPGASEKEWRAFLSTSTVDAKDRIGEGPWYDRAGRLVAENLEGLIKERPDADPLIIDDLPNEFGVPNHDPDGTGQVDNHDMLTGTNDQGMLYCPDDPAVCTCSDWTSAEPTGRPRVGHAWPRRAGGGGGGGLGDLFGELLGGLLAAMNNWMSSLDEAGCAPGVSLIEMGPPMASNPTVGSGGGYGGFYCFALTP